MSDPGPLFDPAAFRRELDAVMKRDRDPELHAVIWSCIEGRITRRQLRQDPAYRTAVGDYYRDRFAELEKEGVDFSAICREVREYVEDEDRRNGTDLAHRILTPAESEE